MPWIVPVVLAPAVVQHREAQDDARIPSGRGHGQSVPVGANPPRVVPSVDMACPRWSGVGQTRTHHCHQHVLHGLRLLCAHRDRVSLASVRPHPDILSVGRTRHPRRWWHSAKWRTGYRPHTACGVANAPMTEEGTTRPTPRGHGHHVYGTGDRGSCPPGPPRYATSRCDGPQRGPGSGAPTPPLHVAIAAVSASGTAGEAQLS